jgi:hypothetical protein
MTKPSRWTLEAVFRSLVGLTMAVLFAGACVVGQRPSRGGSGLVPAAVLQKLVDNGRACQTISDDDGLLPRRHC